MTLVVDNQMNTFLMRTTKVERKLHFSLTPMLRQCVRVVSNKLTTMSIHTQKHPDRLQAQRKHKPRQLAPLGPEPCLCHRKSKHAREICFYSLWPHREDSWEQFQFHGGGEMREAKRNLEDDNTIAKGIYSIRLSLFPHTYSALFSLSI